MPEQIRVHVHHSLEVGHWYPRVALKGVKSFLPHIRVVGRLRVGLQDIKRRSLEILPLNALQSLRGRKLGNLGSVNLRCRFYVVILHFKLPNSAHRLFFLLP